MFSCERPRVLATVISHTAYFSISAFQSGDQHHDRLPTCRPALNSICISSKRLIYLVASHGRDRARYINVDYAFIGMSQQRKYATRVERVTTYRIGHVHMKDPGWDESRYTTV